MSNKSRGNSLLKLMATDAAGIGCLILVPIIGPLPGPGGIPLIIAGLGLLAQNHEFARNWLKYVKKHSDSTREIIFPNVTWTKWGWDIISFILLVAGTWASFQFDDNRLLKIMAVGVLASSSTVFMMNRNRIDTLEKFLGRKK